MNSLTKEFEVAASVEHAFDTWTRRIGTWWPRGHTMAGDDHDDVVFDPEAGRIFERTTSGGELDWGEITAWEPPHRVAYRWFLFFDRAEATDVEVTFAPTETGTRVRIEQAGFDRLGAQGPPRRRRTDQAWDTLAAAFRSALEADGFAGRAPSVP